MDADYHKVCKLNGSIQNSVSRLVILNLPPMIAEIEASSENGLSKLLVGGVGFSWSGSMGANFFIIKLAYQSFSSLSSLPSKKIAN